MTSRRARVLSAVLVPIAAIVAVLGIVLGVPWVDRAVPISAAETAGTATTSGLPRAAFIGDSYTVGKGATAARLGWAPQVAKAEGWDELDLGISGSGYDRTGTRPGATTYLQRIDAVTELDPDIVVVSGGYNDIHHDDHAERNAVPAVYQALRRALPHARIIAIGPFWPHAAVTTNVRLVDRAVRKAAAEVGAFYISGIDPNPIAVRSLVAADGIHPDDAGHAAIAAQVVAQLAACRTDHISACS